MADVLVLGGGMAGAMAALSARRLGAEVLLVRRALGASALSSGAIDVGADPSADLLGQAHSSPSEVVSCVARHFPQHPYATLRPHWGKVTEALEFAARALDPLLSIPADKMLLLPTPLGTTKPAALAQRSQVAADLMSLPEKVAVVEFWPNPSFDGKLVAQGLESAARALGRTLAASVVSCRILPRIEDALLGPYELASRFDSESELEKLGDQLRRDLPKGVGAVLLPPWLGLERLDCVQKLSAMLGVPCAELLSTSPSVPGMRLQRALDRALDLAGVRHLQAEITDLKAEEKGFTCEVASARTAVLCTGKFIGGGIARRGEEFVEPALGLAVSTGARWTGMEYVGAMLAPSAFGRHELFAAGVLVDAQLRPLTSEATPFSDRLFAAGAVLAGHDPAVDNTGLGLAVFTGYLAGEFACRSLE